MEDLQKTQHYTTEAAEICKNLIQDIPNGVLLVEPFAGEEDLLPLFPNHEWILYDIDSSLENPITQDTLKNPPDYEQKWVITNPPYLAKNKAQNKDLFLEYGLDDLYKISLKTFLKAEGGIVIIPTNFLTDERSEKIRKIFFDRFKIIRLNIFTKPIFKSTTYSVCSFSFIKKDKEEKEIIFPVYLPQEKKETIFSLKEDYGYRLAGEFYHKFKEIKPIFRRLRNGESEVKNITKIKLYALDSRDKKIRLTFGEDPYYGKDTDRVFATFVSNIEISEDIQEKIVERFNKELNFFREEYLELSLTNYRDFNRKRIGFDFAYKLATFVYNEIMEELK